MIFSFRYKLSLIIFFVSLLMLLSAFFAIQNVIEKEFRLVIEQRLLQAKDVVNQRMEDRFDRLLIQAITVAENKLTQDIITDKNLSMATRDDILRAEIMPTILLADSMLITDDEGTLLAETFTHDPFWVKLQKQSAFLQGITGEEVSGILSLDGELLQWVLLPVFIGDQMFGTVILVSDFDKKELLAISQLTGTELLILFDDVLLATGWQKKRASDAFGNNDAPDKLSFSELEKNTRQGSYSGEETTEVNLQGERYLIRYSIPDNPFTPPYVLAQSLDRSLAFVDTIKQLMLTIGFIALIIAAAVGFALSHSVSKPIRLLSRANRAVAREDFSQRVNIKTRDEFRELGESFNHMSESLAEKEKIRRTLEKSVSPEVAEHLMKQGAQLGGESREVTILFADMKGFTSLSEKVTEDQLLMLLNTYFTRINSCIQTYHGTIDKYIGDAVMVLFGAPVDDAHHAHHAIQAAHAICETVLKFNQEISEKYGCNIDIGIGINTGRVVSGLVGSEERMSYTVLGDHVNIASRVEGLSKLYGARIITTEDTKISAQEQAGKDCAYVYRRLDKVQMKGKSIGISVFQPILYSDEIDSKLSLYNAAYEFILNHDIDHAIHSFEKYIQKWPEDPVVNIWFKRCLMYDQHLEAFTRDYRDGVRIINTK